MDLTNRNPNTKEQPMLTLTMAQWKKKHRDQTSLIDGQRYCLAYNATTGGTELVPVTVVKARSIWKGSARRGDWPRRNKETK